MRRHVATGSVLLALLACAPSAQAAELQAAYDLYVPGQGFQIGLVNAATGATRSLPAGVNTTDDELHPTLSSDGRFLVFTRMKLLPKLNGDIVPPTTRTLVWADLTTGEVTALGVGTGGAGPTFTNLRGNPELTWGAVPTTPPGANGTFVGRTTGASNRPIAVGQDIIEPVPAPNLDVPHAASIRDFLPQTPQTTRDARYLSLAYHDPGTGALQRGVARLSLTGVAPLEFGGVNNPSGHPVPRTGDGFVALDRTFEVDRAIGFQTDVHTITYPGETSTTVAPAPITTAAPERLPAWSPDGLQLGFVRTVTGRRKLGLYDLTPGLQTIVNPLVDLGADAPTPQTRQFQSVYGGLSLATIPAAPTVVCNLTCRARITTLTPTVTRSITGQAIGIFVVRRTGGTRTVLGVKQPRVKVIGRVPLGATKKGRNRFEWDGRVSGKRLKPGKYLLTYRLLRGGKVTSTSDSMPFTVRR